MRAFMIIVVSLLINSLLSACEITGPKLGAGVKTVLEISPEIVTALNRASFDPLQVPEEKLAYLDTACAVLVVGQGFFLPDSHTLGERAVQACAVIRQAAARAPRTAVNKAPPDDPPSG